MIYTKISAVWLVEFSCATVAKSLKEPVANPTWVQSIIAPTCADSCQHIACADICNKLEKLFKNYVGHDLVVLHHHSTIIIL